MWTQRGADVVVQVPGRLLAAFPLVQEVSQSPVLLRPPSDCVRATHVMGGNLFYSKYVNLNVKTPSSKTRNI